MESNEMAPSKCNEFPKPRSIEIEGRLRKISELASARLKTIRNRTLRTTTTNPRIR